MGSMGYGIIGKHENETMRMSLVEFILLLPLTKSLFFIFKEIIFLKRIFFKIF